MRLPELITTTSAEYERAAIELATHPGRLAKISERLIGNRRAAPLFDIERYARHLEAAYALMVDRLERGLPPEAIDVRD